MTHNHALMQQHKGTSQGSGAYQAAQIIHIVEQCFAMQDTYGKTPEQLEILQGAMVEDLREFPLSTIQAAFTEWRRSSRKIPTPHDIIRLTSSVAADRNRNSGVKTYSDFDGDFPAYIRYLNARGVPIADSCQKYLDYHAYPDRRRCEREERTPERKEEVAAIVPQAAAKLRYGRTSA